MCNLKENAALNTCLILLGCVIALDLLSRYIEIIMRSLGYSRRTHKTTLGTLIGFATMAFRL